MDDTNIESDAAPSAASPRTGDAKRWLLVAWFSVWPLIAYLELVAPWDVRYVVMKRPFVVCLLFAGSVVLSYVALRRYSRRPNGIGGLQNITVLAISLVLLLLAADTVFNAYTSIRPDFHPNPGALATVGRDHDVWTWDGELMPHEYFPTAANFFVYKPGQIRSGETYGELYYPDLLKHQILRDEVLQSRKVEFIIDKFGFRNIELPSNSDVFALGDSFCFGYHLTQSSVFTSLLKSRLGKPVYNMGVSGNSPFQQYLTLEYFIARHPDSFKPRRVLWLIFEGNDLEDTYEETAAPEPTKPPQRGMVVTMLDYAAGIPMNIRAQSILRRFAVGEVSMGEAKQKESHLWLDGEMMANPLFHSPRFGYLLLRQGYIDRAAAPESYVLNHPNRPRLDETFHRMRTLSQAHDFGVTVVTIPSSARLYKEDFEGLERVSEPHFVRYLTRLAREMEFDVVDLNEALSPYAAREMLYYRDDTHWNERGHQIVADILGDALSLRKRALKN